MHRIRKLHDDEDVGKIVSGSVAVSSEIVNMGLNTNYPETLFWRCEPASRRRSVRSIENKSGMDNLMKRSAVASFDEFLAKRSAVGESNT
jgi:hypothetical protein